METDGWRDTLVMEFKGIIKLYKHIHWPSCTFTQFNIKCNHMIGKPTGNIKKKMVNWKNTTGIFKQRISGFTWHAKLYKPLVDFTNDYKHTMPSNDKRAILVQAPDVYSVIFFLEGKQTSSNFNKGAPTYNPTENKPDTWRLVTNPLPTRTQ